MFNKDLLVIACIIIAESREATEFCASLFGTKLHPPNSAPALGVGVD